MYTYFAESDLLPHDWSFVAWSSKSPVRITHKDGFESASFRLLEVDQSISIPKDFSRQAAGQDSSSEDVNDIQGFDGADSVGPLPEGGEGTPGFDGPESGDGTPGFDGPEGGDNFSGFDGTVNGGEKLAVENEDTGSQYQLSVYLENSEAEKRIYSENIIGINSTTLL